MPKRITPCDIVRTAFIGYLMIFSGQASASPNRVSREVAESDGMKFLCTKTGVCYDPAQLAYSQLTTEEKCQKKIDDQFNMDQSGRLEALDARLQRGDEFGQTPKQFVHAKQKLIGALKKLVEQEHPSVVRACDIFLATQDIKLYIMSPKELTTARQRNAEKYGPIPRGGWLDVKDRTLFLNADVTDADLVGTFIHEACIHGGYSIKNGVACHDQDIPSHLVVCTTAAPYTLPDERHKFSVSYEKCEQAMDKVIAELRGIDYLKAQQTGKPIKISQFSSKIILAHQKSIKGDNEKITVTLPIGPDPKTHSAYQEHVGQTIIHQAIGASNKPIQYMVESVDTEQGTIVAAAVSPEIGFMFRYLGMKANLDRYPKQYEKMGINPISAQLAIDAERAAHFHQYFSGGFLAEVEQCSGMMNNLRDSNSRHTEALVRQCMTGRS